VIVVCVLFLVGIELIEALPPLLKGFIAGLLGQRVVVSVTFIPATHLQAQEDVCEERDDESN